MKKDEFENRMEKLIRAGVALIWIKSYEEELVVKILEKIAKELNRELLVWNAYGVFSSSKDLPLSPATPGELFKRFEDDTSDRKILVAFDFRTYLKDPVVTKVT